MQLMFGQITRARSSNMSHKKISSLFKKLTNTLKNTKV